MRHRITAPVDQFGQVLAVFVWLEGGKYGLALRLKPDSQLAIQRALVSADQIRALESQSGPSDTEIEKIFQALASPRQVAAFLRQVPRTFEYGGKPTWDIVREAALSFGRPVSLKEVGDLISKEIPAFKRKNLGPDLSVITVNCRNRGHHSVNYKPRRSDSGNRYDQLFRTGKGRAVRFERYQPEKHGIWELVDVGAKRLHPQLVTPPSELEIAHARESTQFDESIISEEDARSRTLALIVQREGQQAFRKLLLDAYGGRCAISGCAVDVLLEAAHIVPFNGAPTNSAANGLLLRADLHKLFDLHLIVIDGKTRQVRCSEQLRESEYWQFDGYRLREPVKGRPADKALAHHRARCLWLGG